MTDLRTAAQQALEALERYRFADEIAALRAALVEEALQRLTDVSQEIEAALAEPEQEPVLLQCTTCGTVYAEGVPPQVPVRGPVAYMHKETGLLRREIGRPKGADWDANYWEPLYTHPPKRKPLTDEAYLKELELERQQALEALLMMRDRYSDDDCPACDHADEAIKALRSKR